MQSIQELRTRLAQVSLDDLDAVHELHLRINGLAKTVGPQSPVYLDISELNRRAERAMAIAVLAAQARGELRTRGQSHGNIPKKGVADYMPRRANLTTSYWKHYASVDDEAFEVGLKKARQGGSLSRAALLTALGLDPEPDPVNPTARGRRTLEHLAIQASAISMGVREIGPGEVDPSLVPMAKQAHEDLAVIRGWLKKVIANG
jgi:hypothetical protein